MIRPDMSPDDVRTITDYSTNQDGYIKVLDTFWLKVDPEDESLGKNIMRDRYWEAWVTSWMTKNIKAGMHCFDIGANYGYYTGVLEALGGVVHAFEPNKEFDLAYRSGRPELGRTHVWDKKAVGAETGTAEIHINSKFKGSSSMAIDDGYFDSWGGETTKVNVPVTTLDEYSAPDFIKIDVEGFEPQVFAGGEKTLATNPLIIVELSSEHPQDFIDMLFDKYDVWNINFDGNEDLIAKWQIKTQDWWMVVLRKKQ